MIEFVKPYRQYVTGDQIDPGVGAEIEYIQQGVAKRVKQKAPRRSLGRKGKS
jgi:hypothetical protein